MRRLLLLGFVLVVGSGRLCTVFYAGSPIPYHDQWYAEAQAILMPYFRHGLTARHFFLHNNEHVVALTRLLSFTLIELEGKWDCITQMAVNCAISPFCLLPLMAWAAGRLRPLWSAVFFLVVSALYASPLYYGNIVWGFQSQILLMIAFSAAHLRLFLDPASTRGRLVLGALCGLAAPFCFASGYLAACVSTVVLLGTQSQVRRNPKTLALMVAACIGIIVTSLWVLQPHVPAGTTNPARVFHTTLHALSFPDRYFSYWGGLFWLPSVIALGRLIVDRSFIARIWFPLAGAAWGLAQAIAIGIGRSDPALVLAPRYYDIFTFGTIANLLLGVELVRSFWPRSALRVPVILLLVAWTGVAGYKAIVFAQSHTWGDLPVIKNLSERQLHVVARFYQQHEETSVLDQTPFPGRPLPDTAFLAEMLRQPEIKGLLPSYVLTAGPTTTLRELPWLGQHDKRKEWFRVVLGVAGLGVALLLSVLLWSCINGMSVFRKAVFRSI